MAFNQEFEVRKEEIAMYSKSKYLFLMIGVSFFLFLFPVKRVYPVTIGSEFPIATMEVREESISVAFDGTNYLVGIQGDVSLHHNITAQLVSQTGSLVGSRISVGRTGDVLYVAFDGTNYLVVWEDFRNDTNHNEQCGSGEGTCADIYGQFIAPSGSLVESEIPVSTEVQNQLQ